MQKEKGIAIGYAVMAAVFYALNVPCSKWLLNEVPSTIMAGLLYLGAGVGIGVLFLLHRSKIHKNELLTKSDLPYVIAMVVLDCVAPILLMYGLLYTSSSAASLLNNFEIVATTIIASILFHEAVSKRMWLAVVLVTLASILLSVEDIGNLKFSYGSLFVLLATISWGFENNCTRSISSKNTYEIVTIKGLGSGSGALIVGLLIGEKIPEAHYVVLAMLLGFVAYGLSIYFYIKAQKNLGAAKTSAYYAIAPFIGTFQSFLFFDEELEITYYAGLVVMLAGTVVVTLDTLAYEHTHMHTHTITHTHDGSTHTHVVMHSHEHVHVLHGNEHGHTHSKEELEKLIHEEHHEVS